MDCYLLNNYFIFMFKFKKVGDTKYLVDSKGLFMKNEAGENIVADETITEEFVDTTTDEAQLDADVAEATEEILSKVDEAIETKTNGKFRQFAKAIGQSKALEAMTETKTVENPLRKTVETGLKSLSSTGKSFEFSVKTLSELNSLTGDVIMPARETEITRDPQRMPLMESIASVTPINSNKVEWTEVLNETGAPAQTAELAKFPVKDWTFGIFDAKVKKSAVYTKASNEIKEDMGELVNIVNSFLVEDLNLHVDQQLLNGDGTGENLTGIFTISPTFTGGTLAGSVDDPNNMDVLRAAIAEIQVVGNGKFMPNAILMNPADVALMELTKGTDGHYVMPPFSTAERTQISGVRIIANTAIPAGEFLAGDFSKFRIRQARGLTVQVAVENEDDFLRDMFTIRASRRLVSYMRTNDNGAFVKGDFATAKTLIEK
jgi:HK97 family phage major capsid protein